MSPHIKWTYWKNLFCNCTHYQKWNLLHKDVLINLKWRQTMTTVNYLQVETHSLSIQNGPVIRQVIYGERQPVIFNYQIRSYGGGVGREMNTMHLYGRHHHQVKFTSSSLLAHVFVEHRNARTVSAQKCRLNVLVRVNVVGNATMCDENGHKL